MDGHSVAFEEISKYFLEHEANNEVKDNSDVATEKEVEVCPEIVCISQVKMFVERVISDSAKRVI